MIMTLKNKITLAMDKLIVEAKNKNGIPANILLDPQEAVEFIKELQQNKELCQEHITFKHAETGDTNITFFLPAEITNENIKMFVQDWYKEKFSVNYKEIEVMVINKSVPSVVTSATDTNNVKKYYEPNCCEMCGSDVHRKWLFFADGCMQPKCENYYKK